ncbi:hypothetical protein EVAR_47831_1 [Eumeta japonica]|uniref:Uncharacterized protein n=1 Tax=Eumeta variegata TaxID=151549 RepID=A0A4C1XWQ5_EUMVA|nr:hypothetical protein EVAR_47831_1 [Eumeta japonica]
MASEFHQIPIATNYVEKTSFAIPDGLLEYLTIPFGWLKIKQRRDATLHLSINDLLKGNRKSAIFWRIMCLSAHVKIQFWALERLPYYHYRSGGA